jgi:hypothetical protein
MNAFHFPAFEARIAFALLCSLAIVVVMVGAMLEIARARREAAVGRGAIGDGDETVGRALVPPNQLRLRLFSALIWILALASFAFAMLFLWPAKGDTMMARKFVSVVSGASLLLLIALWLLLYDVWQVGRHRRGREKLFERELETLGQQEIERLRPAAPASPADNSSSSSS